MIYLLDEDPVKCAQYLDDIALDKQIREIAQALCNVHWILITEEITDETKASHPLNYLDRLKFDFTKESEYSKWASLCRANYLRLVDMAEWCLIEYYFRINKNVSEPRSHTKNLTIKRMIGYQEYAVWMSQAAKLAGFKVHKYHHSIDFARDNAPDLPVFYEAPEDTAEETLDYTYKNEMPPTAFPLVMPSKYLDSIIYPSSHPYRFDTKYISMAYRNYYRANFLKKDIQCKDCKGEGGYEIEPGNIDTWFECNNAACHEGYIIPVWTRRPYPDWLNLEGEK